MILKGCLSRWFVVNVMIGEVEYILTIDDGKTVLSRFNEKYNMWVRLLFSDVSAENSFAEVLSKQFIRGFE